MKYSSSKENYIKAIYHLEQEEPVVSTNALARQLSTKPASVTDMLKKLHEQDLLEYEPYKGVRLTESGKTVALQIIRKHRLWEFFLVEKLGFGWEEVHEIAEELEHISSRKLIDRLDEFLGKPKTDPHGDPIPDANGKMPLIEKICLMDLPTGIAADIISVSNQSADMLDLLKHYSIEIGTRLEITNRFQFDRSLQLIVQGKSKITISEHLAMHLFVVYAKETGSK
ncbi:metal-dependent transcriptional regulator [Flavihumibacter sp. CACIAM 22H1]|uniref:metal-dependent transcriptional regulator n=1 Tax=Flavihumibacter sp. CACIAM 22H1 TaxID=1812911 RepID=UPI0007A805E8|nr:metal-dependent transcriptional regulator [Flavihumibacter sp. CACIAM 22H1]KYP13137.1 MAG: iron-dependent repressor [Flavihumibacter sp. CACIAM 22H1]